MRRNRTAIMYFRFFTAPKPESTASRAFGGTGNDKLWSHHDRRDVLGCGSGRDQAMTYERRLGDEVRRNCERRP